MELRLDLWKVHMMYMLLYVKYVSLQECLGVSRRPDTLGTWSGPLDCDGQDIIHTQCQQAGGIVDIISVQCQLSNPPS